MNRSEKIKQEKLKREARYPKTKHSRKDVTKFLIIAVVLMIVVDQLVFEGLGSRFEEIKKEYYMEQALKQKTLDDAIEALLPPEVVFPDDGSEYFEATDDLEESFKKELLLEKQSNIVTPQSKPVMKSKVKTPKKKIARILRKGEKAKIAIVIDDLGMNLKQSRAAIALPKQVTLAFLPYAEKVRALAKTAKAGGHELIIHTPMEAMNAKLSLGPMALRQGMTATAFNAEFQKITESFDGYIGINNHMGSRLTQDKPAMERLMKQLKQRDLFFFDSKTINTSIAAQTARANGIPYAERDVFLDHEGTPQFIAKALLNVERIAREQGHAIAIGHPKAVTMQALQKWLPTLAAKGYQLVPLSELVVTSNKSTRVKKTVRAAGFKEPKKLTFSKAVFYGEESESLSEIRKDWATLYMFENKE